MESMESKAKVVTMEASKLFEKYHNTSPETIIIEIMERIIFLTKVVEAIDDKDIIKMIKTSLKETEAVREN